MPLEGNERLHKLKLKALRYAAKQGFDEIDQGKGILLKGRHAINQFVTDIETEGGRVLHNSIDLEAILPEEYRRCPE